MMALFVALNMNAQKPQMMRSTMIGGGVNNVLDTYLSPFNYTGFDLRIMHETLRQTKQMEGRIYYHTLLDINGDYLTNRSNTAHEYMAGIRYSNAWLYSLPLREGWGGYLGLQPSVCIGGIYNTRNGNNPAQAKADLMLNATARVHYGLHLFGKLFPISYQLTVPLVGAAYSPNYGQSYYEEFSLGNYDHNVCFAHIANMPSMRHLLTIDIPIRKNYLRIGWSGEFNQAKLNGLRYHSYANNFLIGYTKKY